MGSLADQIVGRIIAKSAPLIVERAARYPDEAAIRVVKTQAEQRFTLGVAYPALRVDKGVAADGHRDFVMPDKLEQTAWNWMKNHRVIGLHHAEGTSGYGEVVESYIWRADPWVIKASDGSEQTVYPGDWVLGAVWTPDGWQMVKSGLLNGWSPQGGARRAIPTAAQLAQLRR